MKDQRARPTTGESSTTAREDSIVDPLLSWFQGGDDDKAEKKEDPPPDLLSSLLPGMLLSPSLFSGGGGDDDSGGFFGDIGSFLMDVGSDIGDGFSYVGGKIVDGLETADSWVEGSGEDSDLHGFRLTATGDCAYNGPAIHGHAERDLNVDLLLALGNAKGMSLKPGSFSSLKGLQGRKLYEAIKENAELMEEGFEIIEQLLEEGKKLAGSEGDPETAALLEGHLQWLKKQQAIDAGEVIEDDAVAEPEEIVAVDEVITTGLGGGTSTGLGGTGTGSTGSTGSGSTGSLTDGASKSVDKSSTTPDEDVSTALPECAADEVLVCGIKKDPIPVKAWKLPVKTYKTHHRSNFYLKERYADGKTYYYILDYRKEYSAVRNPKADAWTKIRTRKQNSDGTWEHDTDFGALMREGETQKLWGGGSY